MSELVQGALYPAVRSGDIRGYHAPIAPLNEQRRIADKLDAILARVDACRERLDRVPAILKRLRQSVLAEATLGRLTEDWRAGGAPLVQPERCAVNVGSEIAHIPKQVATPDLSGSDGKSSDNASGAYPPAWGHCRIRDAGAIQLGRQRSPKFHSGKTMRPYLRVQNVFEDRLDFSDVMHMDFPGNDSERYALHVGDILLNEGQSPAFLGRPAMYRGELPGACFTNTLIRFQAFPHIKAEFALLVFRHHMHSGRHRTEGTITTNIAHLSVGRFGNIEFPLPPLAEQIEIVRRAESLFAYADRLEARYQAARALIDRLTPALLAKAFRGELVPQDPDDEPASLLLERIRAARAAEPPKPGRRGGGRRATAAPNPSAPSRPSARVRKE